MKGFLILTVIALGLLIFTATCDRTQARMKFSKEIKKTIDDAYVLKWEDNEYGYLFDKEFDYYLATVISNNVPTQVLVKAYKGHLVSYYSPEETRNKLAKCHAWHTDRKAKKDNQANKESQALQTKDLRSTNK